MWVFSLSFLRGKVLSTDGGDETCMLGSSRNDAPSGFSSDGQPWCKKVGGVYDVIQIWHVAAWGRCVWPRLQSTSLAPRRHVPRHRAPYYFFSSVPLVVRRPSRSDRGCKIPNVGYLRAMMNSTLRCEENALHKLPGRASHSCSRPPGYLTRRI